MGNSCIKLVRNETEFEINPIRVKSKLKRLKVDQSLITEKKLEVLFKDITFDALEVASFGGNSCISSKGWSLVRTSLLIPSCESLFKLQLYKCSLDCNKVDVLFREVVLSRMRTIDIGGNSIISNEGWHLITRQLIAPSYLTLRKVYFPDCVIDSEICKTLFSSLTLASVVDLDMKSNNKIGDGSWAYVRKNILEISVDKLRRLNIYNCQLDQSKIIHTFGGLTFHRLLDLHLGMNSRVSPEGWVLVRNHLILPCMKTLRTLNLYWCELEYASINAIFKNVFLPSLKEFNLGGNSRISEDGWNLINKSVFQPACYNIEKVHLWYCSLDNVKLTLLLEECTFYSLTELDLGMNPDLTSEGWYSVNTQMIQTSHRSLHSILLYFCKLNIDSFNTLFASKPLLSLKFMELGMNSEIKEDDLSAIDRRLKVHNKDFFLKY